MPESGFVWVTLLLSDVRNRRASFITDHTTTGHLETCKCLSGPRNVLNIMPSINRLFSLVEVNNVFYLNKIFKSNTIL
jgi:hypothetical protein